jgi:uncharacterized protein
VRASHSSASSGNSPRPTSAAAEELLRADPVTNCFIDARVRWAGLDPWRMGGDMWGYFDDDRLTSLVYTGANLVPVATTPASRAAFADRLRAMPRRCSSFVGPAEEVLGSVAVA